MKWCDLECPHAAWPDSAALSGACRTFQALWCKKLKRVVQKNGVCQANAPARPTSARRRPARRR